MRRWLVFPLAFVLFAWCTASAQTLRQIPLDSPIYDHLEHFRALGYWSGGLEVRPIRGADLLEAMRDIEAGVRARPLTAGDAQRLDVLRRAAAHLTAAVRAVRADSARRDVPPSLWSFGGNLQFFGQATNLDSLPDLDRRPRRDYFFSMWFDAELPQGLYAQWRFFQDYTKLTPSPGDQNWVDNLPPNLRDTLTDGSARNDLAALGYGNGWLNVEFGRRERHWGPGRRGTLFLSENPFPLDGLSLQFRTRYVVLTSLFAQSRRGNQSGDGYAYVASHRVEIRPPLPFRIGLFESVAYGNRPIDLAYTNPIGFFVAMTQDITDRSGTDDKKVLGVDFQADIQPVSLYAELLVDRVVVLDAGQDGPDSEISSFGQLFGLRWANPFGWRGSDLDVEYAHLDPQVYFHNDGDETRSLLSEGELMGHWLGPNAGSVHAALASPPIGRAGTLQLSYEHSRYGILDGKRGTELGFIGLKKRDKQWITGAQGIERIMALRWERRAWPTGWGDLDTAVGAARVVHTGAFRPAKGWLVEMRVQWKLGWSSVF